MLPLPPLRPPDLSGVGPSLTRIFFELDGVVNMDPLAARPRSRGPASVSPPSTRSRASGEQDAADHHDPQEADDGDTSREYTPSGAQNPPLSHVVPPSRTSTTAATPTANSPLEISRARQQPECRGHRQHCAREGTQHNASPREVVERTQRARSYQSPQSSTPGLR